MATEPWRMGPKLDRSVSGHCAERVEARQCQLQRMHSHHLHRAPRYRAGTASMGATARKTVDWLVERVKRTTTI